MTAAIALAIFSGTTAGSAPGVSPEAAIATLRRATAKGAEAKGAERTAKEAAVKVAVERFTDGIARAKDVKAALANPAVQAVLLPALGLADAVGQTGLLTRALTSDPAVKTSVAARLPDARWKEAASTLNLATRGMDALRDPAVQKKLVEGYVAYTWRTSQDKEAPGVSDALYLKDRAASGKALTVWDVLGDQVLRRVVTGALGLPQAIAVQPIETQARAVSTRLDLASLSDPKKAARLAEQYVLARAKDAAGPASSPLLSLFT